MFPTFHRFADVNGRKVFYREAGDPALPTILLLRGIPTSSQMFRDLIRALADSFHVIAPDYIGFGHSEAPSATEFKYTCDNLAAEVAALVDHLGLSSYILYMQDNGGPIGLRLFTQHPEQVTGLVVQNANAYLEGVGDMPKQIFLPLWSERNAANETAARGFLAAETTKFQYLVDARNEQAISPDNWTRDQALLDRPGVDASQLDLLEDYKSNVAVYDSWRAAFRQHQPRTLIVWGKNDPFFIATGAEAFQRDQPQAKLVWLDAGHFALDENAASVADETKTEFAAA
jgi:pimeloyl-ACP methyl ester carboxylesterase